MSTETEQQQDDQTTEQHQEASLGDAGKRALEAEREARKAAEKEAREAKQKLDQIEAAQREADEAQAAEQGRWKELAEKREADLSTATTDLTAARERLATLEALVKADVDAAWDDLPEEVRDAYDGPDDDPLAKKRHMQRMAKVIERLTADANRKIGNGPNPPVGDGAFNFDRAKDVARSTGRYSI